MSGLAVGARGCRQREKMLRTSFKRCGRQIGECVLAQARHDHACRLLGQSHGVSRLVAWSGLMLVLSAPLKHFIRLHIQVQPEDACAW